MKTSMSTPDSTYGIMCMQHNILHHSHMIKANQTTTVNLHAEKKLSRLMADRKLFQSMSDHTQTVHAMMPPPQLTSGCFFNYSNAYLERVPLL